MPSSERSGAAFVLIGVIGYVLLPVWIKLLQVSGLAPFDLATWRFVFAAPLVWLVLKLLRTPRAAKPLPRLGLLGLGALLVVAALSMFFGLERVPASTYIVLFYTYPAMVALINLILGERMPLQSWLALGLTLTGVALTVPDFGVGLSGEAWAGLLIAFVNALAVAVYFILNSRLMRGHGSVSWASGWAISGACLTMLLITAVRGGVALPPDVRTWALLLTMALASTVMPIFMFMVGIQRLGPSRAAILSTVEPIGTLIVATLLLGESVQEIQLVGAALILSSVVLLQLSTRRPEPIPVVAAGD